MEREYVTLTAEQEQLPEQRQQVFDLGQLEPFQVADLIAILGAKFDAEVEHNYRTGEDTPSTAGGFVNMLGYELQYVARHSDKAIEIYIALMNEPSSGWPPILATDHMAADLLRSNIDNLEIRQQVLIPWMGLLHHENDLVRETARDTLSNLVHADWLDESTARLIDSQLPEDFQRDEW